MRRIVIVASVLVLLGVGTLPASGQMRYSDRYDDREYVDGMSHPLRVAAYLAYPLGFAAEWLIFRPFHFIISRPGLDEYFGYHGAEDSDIQL